MIRRLLAFLGFRRDHVPQYPFRLTVDPRIEALFQEVDRDH